ncbi:MAG: hypothetical protein M0Q24_05185 [Sulfurimonas sp.]|uniref:immunoglobulin-like domain-containing protein n=1 Tax=Sulfurimonas sp. TaxID=2022749 RepID=UPI0025DE9631|nr:immunoglobulin-like domain-containing protein [Sulfurimonas sp.]MCK9491464.1 hypothetical protein [Sulfurimonas sp.]
MAVVIATVKEIEGTFFAKDSSSNIIELKKGDVITKDMLVFGDKSNSSSAKIEMNVEGGSSIVLNATQEQLFDASLIDELSQEEGLTELSIKKALDESLYAQEDAEAKQENEDLALLDETAAGEERPKSSEAGEGEFEQRDGAQTDITSELRDAEFGLDGTNRELDEDQIIINNTTDEIDPPYTSSYTLTSSMTGDEDGATVTYTVTFDTPPTANETITFKVDGVEKSITVKAGETTGTTTLEYSDPDVYIDPDTISAPTDLTTTNNSGYDTLTPVNSATSHEITDTINDTTVTLNDVTVNEGAGTATISASIDNAPKDGPLVIALDNGSTVTFNVGETSATSTPFAIQGDDAYKDGETIIVKASVQSGGDEFENLVTTDTATVTVSDTINDTTVTLNDVTVNEGAGTATISASIDNAPKDGPLVIALDNGSTVTFNVGETSATSTPFAIQGDDAYKDGETIIVKASVQSGGDEFENLVTTDTATVTVSDTINDTTVTLTATSTITEAGADVIYTATLTNASQGDTVVTLDNGKTITITDGQTTGTATVTVAADEDVYLDATSMSAAITTATGGNFENLVVDSTPAVTTITDTIDTTTVSLTGTVTKPIVIDIGNVKDTQNGVEITAYDIEGNETEISINTNENHAGFGVEGKSSGDDSELGHKDGNSEKIVVEFDNEVKSLDVAFAWRHNGEKAVVTFIDKEGNVVGSAMISGGGNDQEALVTYYDENGIKTKEEAAAGGSDEIDLEYKFEPGNGQTFSKVEFSAPGDNDDYLINKIVYKEVVNSDTSNVINENGEVTLEIQTSNPPQEGTAAVATVVVYGVEHSIELDVNGRGTLNVVLKEGEELNATVTEIKGGNFEAVELSGASWELPNLVPTSFNNESHEMNFNEANIDTNLVLTLDISGSMSSKLALAKESLVNLINKYDELGDIKVMLTTFSDYGSTVKEGNSVWLSAENAIEAIDKLKAKGGTNYDDALLNITAGFSKEEAPLEGKTISYFVSDGEPTYGMYQKNNGTWKRDGNGSKLTDINDDIVNNWKALNIDKTYTIGIGTDELNEYLREISKTPDDDVIIINDAKDLSSTLESTVDASIKGNAFDNISGGDGEISIDSIRVDDNEYTKNSFPEDGLAIGEDGKLLFDFDTGDYSYSAKSDEFDNNTVKSFSVTASDEDGDETTFDVNIDIQVDAQINTLVLNSKENIDFSNIDNLEKIDTIDLSQEGKNEVLNLSLEDVLEISNSGKSITIKGDDEDKVSFADTDDWTKGDSSDGFITYTNDTNSDVTVKIDEDIQQPIG